MTARFIVADVFDGLAQLKDESVDLVVTSPPFLALRSYLPADHPDKDKEIGSEATPAEFIDTLLAVTAELRRVLAPHGSICVELGDTYAGSGGAGGDYNADGLREGQPKFRQRSGWHRSGNEPTERYRNLGAVDTGSPNGGPGWPPAKSRTLIPQLYEIALAYGFNPLTGQSSPAGRWRVRNVVTWARPNPPVGALGDKWRPATSDVVVACVSDRRYWDDLATRKPFTGHGFTEGSERRSPDEESTHRNWSNGLQQRINTHSGAPLLDYWEIPPSGYKGSHYAVFPSALVEPLVKAMCPQKVCRTCGEPSRRIVEPNYVPDNSGGTGMRRDGSEPNGNERGIHGPDAKRMSIAHKTLGFTDCGHDDYRPGIVLDPFAGSGTTLAVATGHGHDAIGIDLDERNADLAMERVGPFLMELA